MAMVMLATIRWEVVDDDARKFAVVDIGRGAEGKIFSAKESFRSRGNFPQPIDSQEMWSPRSVTTPLF